MAFFSSKNDVFSSNTCQFFKKQYFYKPVRISIAILMQIKKKKLFLFQLEICGSSSACRKKTRCRRMALVPPFWDIYQWQNFPGNLNTWPNTSSKRFFLLPFLQPKKNVQKSMLLHWCCPLSSRHWVLWSTSIQFNICFDTKHFVSNRIGYSRERLRFNSKKFCIFFIIVFCSFVFLGITKKKVGYLLQKNSQKLESYEGIKLE